MEVGERGNARTAEESLSARTSTLWIGFAGLLLLMAAAAFDSVRSIRQAEAMRAAVREGSRERDRLLNDLRADIYHSSTVVRDYLLETDDRKAADQKAEIERTEAETRQDLESYQEGLPEDSRQALLDLSHDVTAYWDSLVPVLHWSPAQRRKNGVAYLHDQLTPRRTEVVALVKRASDINEQDVDAAEQQLQRASAALAKRVTGVFGIGIAVGIGLAVLSIRRIQRLEREAEARYGDVEEARWQLRRLSNRLVTAQEEERRKISRELHDEVGQAMSAMLVELGRLEAAAPGGGPYREKLAAVRRMAEANVGSIRNIALLLRPSMLDELGLIPALRWQAREVSRGTGLTVKMVAEEIEEEGLPETHKTCLYRVVQEALHNCVRHSQAHEVRVVVRQDADGVSVSVQDDGVGFNPREEKGMGLLGMEERVARLGGMLRVESEAGRGTVISIRFQIPSEQGERLESRV